MSLIKMVLLFYSDYASVVFVLLAFIHILSETFPRFVLFFINRGGAEGTPVGATWEKPNYEIFV